MSDLIELDGILSKSLPFVRYLRVSQLIYAHEDSNLEVGHYIYFSIDRFQSINIDFGVFNERAHLFSLKMILENGGQLFRQTEGTLRSTHNFMRFSLDRFSAASLGGRLTLHDPDALHKINVRIAGSLTDFVKGLRNKRNLFDLLVSDSEPCPWCAVNGAIRAAQIAALGADLGETNEAIAHLLQIKEKLISGQLSNEVSAANFVSAVLRHARMPN